jgi:hypothetical protein
MQVTLIPQDGIKDLTDELIMDNGKMKLLSYKDYDKFDWKDFRTFCHVNARYGVPTIELVDYLRQAIDGRSAIEIGAGAGDLGFHLGIKMTDSKMQERPDIIKSYTAMRQPLIKYPDDVEKLDALEAVKKYKPDVVIGSWITTYAPHEMPYGSNPWGIKEKEILSKVETFIIVGNTNVHGDKPLRQKKHLTIHGNWIVSRAQNPDHNCIFVWENDV